jgi:hypothetical protein
VVTRQALVALAIVVGGALAAFTVYAFGWHDSATRTITVSTPRGDPFAKTVRDVTGTHRVYTLRYGDVARRPEAAAECGAYAEGGFPNLICTRIGGGRGSVVFYKDSVHVYDSKSEPFEPSFTVRWEPKRRQK